MKNATLILTRAERQLRIYLLGFSIFYIGAFILYIYPSIGELPLFLNKLSFLEEPFFANNSGFKAGLCITLGLTAWADIRRFDRLAKILIISFILGLIGSAFIFFFLKNNKIFIVFGMQLSMKLIILLSSIFDMLVIGVLNVLLSKAQKSRYDLKYLSPMEFRVAEALAEVVISGDKLQITPLEIAQNLDKYLAGFGGTNKKITKIVLIGMQLFPLIKFRPPLSYMQPDERLIFLKIRFKDAYFAGYPKIYKDIIQAAIRMSKQLCYMGYYNDSKVHQSIGYIPFEKRVNISERLSRFPINTPLLGDLLNVMNEDNFDEDKEYDVVIVGSGAGASLMAKGLVEQGRSVLMIEKGLYAKPSTFVGDEIAMISKLYADGALQLSSDFKFQVIQGSCVGGSTTVNNAVCFDTPEHIIKQWTKQVGLDGKKYREKMKEVNTIAGVRRIEGIPQMTDETFLNPCYHQFKRGLDVLGLASINKYNSVAANVEGCLGCGYCNIGCGFGKKLSMLDNVLPKIQKDFPGMLEIVAGCEVMKLKKLDNRITELAGRFSSKKQVKIKAKTFVVSGGAVNSSVLLLKSGIKNQVGKKLCFNVGTQITAVFPEKINAYDGLQISHYLQSSGKRYIMETWYNPPMFQSTAMPGWFENHFENMLAYDRIACTGVLIPSDTNGEVSIPKLSLTGRDIKYTPTNQDFNDLIEGLWLSAKIYLAAGAERVMPNTFHYFEYTQAEYQRNPVALENRFKAEVIQEELSLGTGHPQGGNSMALSLEDGVVGADFKVFGTDNLFIADASIFPSSIGVNPQITVMTMAYYASDFVAKN